MVLVGRRGGIGLSEGGRLHGRVELDVSVLGNARGRCIASGRDSLPFEVEEIACMSKAKIKSFLSFAKTSECGMRINCPSFCYHSPFFR